MNRTKILCHVMLCHVMSPCPHLGVYRPLPEPGLKLVEDDCDGVQLLVCEGRHHQLLAEGVNMFPEN